MTFVIAVLLGLILVAMVSSNKAAAAGVWKVCRFALWGVAALIVWAAIIGTVLAFNASYPPDSEWGIYVGLGLAFTLPPLFLWLNRKPIVTAYRKSKWAAVKHGAYLFTGFAGYVAVFVLLREMQKRYEYGGWILLLGALAICALILLVRSFTGPQGWHQVWMGPPRDSLPWMAVADERDKFNLAQTAEWEKVEEHWDSWSPEQQGDWRREHESREEVEDVRLAALHERLESEQAAVNDVWTVRNFFWIFVVLAGFGLAGILWDYALAYAMELKFVKGNSWLAGGVVVVACLALVGAVSSIWDDMAAKRHKKS